MKVPYAKVYEVGLCKNPNCKSVHITLFDHDDQPMVQAAIRLNEVPKLIKVLQDYAYHLATTTKEQKNTE